MLNPPLNEYSGVNYATGLSVSIEPAENLQSCYPVRKSEIYHIEIIDYHRHLEGALPMCSYLPGVVKLYPFGRPHLLTLCVKQNRNYWRIITSSKENELMRLRM